MLILQPKKDFFLPGAVLITSALMVGGAIAATPNSAPYVPNAMITKQVTEADLFSEAMVQGHSEGILVGDTAKKMQSSLQVNTPVRAKVVKGETASNNCQIMYMSMAMSGINAPKAGVTNGDYVFTNKMTLCPDQNAPIIDVVSCQFAGRSCMPLSQTAAK